jgi:glucose/arabinose dehydrogenase
VEIEARVIATNLEAPWEVVFADDRVFLTERDSGDVLELADDGATEVVLSLDIDPAGEGGLLGLIADPDADELGFYAFLTTAEDNRIVRVAPGGEPEPVLTGIPKARIHNGGRIAFGPDGMLYAATGDAGEPGLAQDPGSLAGKILRITADGSVPEDNPDPDSPVYASGIRNPQGLAWTADGTLYSSSFGPDRDDEVNRIEPGANYGWPEVTGEAGVEGFTDPVFVRQPPEASWSGIAALVDGAIPQWEGDLFVAALRGERLWRLALAEDGTVAESEELFVGELGRLRQAVQAPDGSLWILTSNLDGRGSPVDDDDRIVRVGPVGS